MLEGKVDELRALLASMNRAPGVVDPESELVPFGQFDRLHVASFVVLEAPTADDITVYGMAPGPWPPSLVFLGDIDGPADSFLHDLVSRAPTRVFAGSSPTARTSRRTSTCSPG